MSLNRNMYITKHLHKVLNRPYDSLFYFLVLDFNQ